MKIYNWSHFQKGCEREIDWESDESYVISNPKAREPRVEIFPSLPGHIWLATSGTSVHKKWIALSKKAIEISSRSVNNHFALSHYDTWLHALPLFHIGGLAILARSFFSGSRIVQGVQNTWDPDFFLYQLRSHSATVASLVPTQLFDLVEKQSRPAKSLRLVILGGAKLEQTLAAKAKELQWPIVSSYGMTETSSMVAVSADPSREKLMTLPHAALSVNEGQRIVVTSRALFSGQLVECDGEWVFHERVLEDSFETEDIGEMQGRELTILGREWEYVKILGEKVHLGLIEQKILAMNIKGLRLHNFAVLPFENERRGFSLMLVTQHPLARSVAQINQELSSLEQLDKHIIIKEFPYTELGKLKRRELLTLARKKLIDP